MMIAIAIFNILAPWILLFVCGISKYYGAQATYWRAVMETGGFSYQFYLNLSDWDTKNQPNAFHKAFRKYKTPLQRYAEAGNAIPLNEVSSACTSDYFFNDYFGAFAKTLKK